MAQPVRVVLIECGSFNPITNMHLRMFEVARDYLHRLGQYYVVGGIVSPVHDTYGKKDLAPAKHRCSMADLALLSSDWIRLESWESEQPGWLETRKVLAHHQQQLLSHPISTVPPSCTNNKCLFDQPFAENDYVTFNNNLNNNSAPPQLKLLCGADLLESFSVPGLWKDEDIIHIVKDYGLVVVTREGSDPAQYIYKSDLLSSLQRNIHIVTEWIPNEVSSTKIRRALKRGESTKYLVPDRVLDYISQHHLYQSPEAPEAHPRLRPRQKRPSSKTKERQIKRKLRQQ